MRRDPAPLHDLVALARWVRLLARVRPAVLSVGTPKAALLGALAGALTGVPTRVYLVRGLRLESAAGRARSVLRAMERLTVAASTQVVAVSASLARALEAERIVPPGRAVVVGAGSSNGVRVRPAPPRPPGDDALPTIGFVGRACADKGIDLLADTVELLAQEGLRGHVLAVGDVEDQVGRVALDRLRDLPGWSLEAPGQVADVWPYYGRMDVLVLFTRREGFPNVVLEAAVAGVPTVATRATGTVDAVQDEVTGRIVPDRTPQACAAALRPLLTDPGAARAMGAAARERAARLYDRETVWRRYEAAYARWADLAVATARRRRVGRHSTTSTKEFPQ